MLGLTNSKTSIELIRFGMLKPRFVNNYIADVKKMLKKYPNKQKINPTQKPNTFSWWFCLSESAQIYPHSIREVLGSLRSPPSSFHFRV